MIVLEILSATSMAPGIFHETIVYDARQFDFVMPNNNIRQGTLFRPFLDQFDRIDDASAAACWCCAAFLDTANRTGFTDCDNDFAEKTIRKVFFSESKAAVVRYFLSCSLMTVSNTEDKLPALTQNNCRVRQKFRVQVAPSQVKTKAQ
jgi:hypothetical protein